MVKTLKAICGDPSKPLKIWNLEIPCYVLEDWTRVLLAKWIQSALWLPSYQSSFFASFMGQNDLKPFIDEKLGKNIFNPLHFIRPGKWGKAAFWYEATLLPQICNMILSARESGKLKLHKYDKIVNQANTLIRAFATVGIIALVDEVTGFQEIREKDELQKILKAYISPALLPWSLMFPKEFYEEIYRLNWWVLDPKAKTKYSVVGKYTNKYVYEQLPYGVLDKLKMTPPKSKAGNYLSKFHQWLTIDIWNPHLKTQIFTIIKLMKISRNWEDFKRNFAQAYPEPDKPRQQELWFKVK